MAITPGSINGEESATVTFKVRTVTVDVNSTVLHQEVLTLGDPESTLGLARVVATTPPSTSYGLVTRPIFNSSAVDNPVRAVFSSTAADNPVRLVFSSTATENPVRPVWSSTQADNKATVYQSSAADLNVTVAGYSTIVTVANQVRVSNSTATDLLVRPVFSSTNTDNPVRAVLSSTAADNPVVISGNSSAVQSGTWTVNIGANVLSSAAPAANSSAVMVREVIPDILNFGSTFLTDTATVIVSSAAATKGFVCAYSITSTVTSPVELVFRRGSTMLWPIVLQAISSAMSGANLAVSAPAYLFKGSSGRPLTLNTSSTVAFKVGIAYWVGP